MAAAGNFAAGFARVFGVGFLLGPAVAACAPFAAAACPAFRTFAAARPSVFRRPFFRAAVVPPARFETFDAFDGDVVAGELFDGFEHFLFGFVHQRNGDAVRPSAAGAADAVDVVFGLGGHFVVDDEGQFGDIQPACRDVGGDEDAQVALFEGGKGFEAGLLRFVAVDGLGGDFAPLQVARDLVDALFGFAEYDDLVHVQIDNQAFEQAAFLEGVYGDDVLFDVGVGGVLRRHFDLFGAVHEVARQFAYRIGEGGGKEQGLALFGQHLHDGADVVDKAHVEHAVGFVEDDDFDFGEVDVFLFDMVEQAADGGDDDFAAGTQIGGLFVHVYAAEEDGVPQGQVFDVGLHVLVDLVGQFAGGGEHQHPDGVHGGGGGSGGEAFEPLEAGQHEGGGFAGAGLRGGQEVVSGEGFGNGGGLNRRGVFVALLGEGGNDFLSEA